MVYILGDAGDMFDNVIGGNDVLIGSAEANRNELIGDAYSMYNNAVGGNDYLVGGDNVNLANAQSATNSSSQYYYNE